MKLNDFSSENFSIEVLSPKISMESGKIKEEGDPEILIMDERVRFIGILAT